jgi:outer membrane protein assembly factor BamB
MNRITKIFTAGSLALLVLYRCASADDLANQNWPQWRGPLATGVAPSGDPPTVWSPEENIRWKATVPGHGHSTPIIWGDQVFVTSAESFGEKLPPNYSGAPGAHDNVPVSHRHRFLTVAIDRRTGALLWQKQLTETLPHEGGHYTASLASNSPVTDGQRLYAYFGSRGLYCLDLDGRLQWQKNFGPMNTKHGHGEGSSPVLRNGTLIVNWDHEGDSFIVALEAKTGRERWRQSRGEVTSWSTPIVVQPTDSPTQVVVPGTHFVRGYDLATGRVIWQCGGMSANIVASPVYADGIVYVGSSYETQALLAIRLGGAAGDITESDHVVWSRRRGTPYVPSLLLHRGSVYFLRHYQGILSRVDARTGEELVGPFRLGPVRNVYASPVAAGNRIYITDLDGTTIVLTDDEVPRVLSVNRLDDQFSASAAIVGKQLFLRGEKTLYCIGQ